MRYHAHKETLSVRSLMQPLTVTPFGAPYKRDSGGDCILDNVFCHAYLFE